MGTRLRPSLRSTRGNGHKKTRPLKWMSPFLSSTNGLRVTSQDPTFKTCTHLEKDSPFYLFHRDYPNTFGFSKTFGFSLSLRGDFPKILFFHYFEIFTEFTRKALNFQKLLRAPKTFSNGPKMINISKFWPAGPNDAPRARIGPHDKP